MRMLRSAMFLAIAVCAAALDGRASSRSPWDDFVNPPDSARPWCYYWWINGHVDERTITADLEAMRELGFGGILLFDSRGYWEDDDHVVNPKAELDWGSPRWYALVEHTLRECARLDLEFTMNVAASGGEMNGFTNGVKYVTDVSDGKAVRAHLDRVVGPILERSPDLVGRTFTHIYSVSYEGGVRKGLTWNVIKDTFYGTMRDWAHSHGLKIYSESGGPWYDDVIKAMDTDQLSVLAFNDFPQGEFWPRGQNAFSPLARHANANGGFFQRGPVLAARRTSSRIVSMEAFTHMMHHWSVDPAYLKPFADQVFADGCNRIVWHTFTASPDKFGVPGAEYFAGSHINRNVTWHKDAGAFVKYLARCQALLQRGEYFDDGEFENITTNYYGWGRFRKDKNAQFTTTHRREGDVDFFFVAGEGRGDVVLNTALNGRTVEIWDAVTGRACRPATAECADGKTRVTLDLPVGGSCFVVLTPGCVGKDSRVERVEVSITNAWQVSFAYHDGISAAPPAPIVMDTLRDWTTYGEDGKADSTALRYFSGTATYKTTVALAAGSLGVSEKGEYLHQSSKTPKLQEAKATFKPSNSRTFKLSIGSLPSGLAHVFVNGKDCGVAWCAPWEVDVSSAIREGENEIELRYTNNWYNRLVGDCFLPEAERVTHSTIRYHAKPRAGDTKNIWSLKPTICSGYAVSDPLQPSGLKGPVEIVFNYNQIQKKGQSDDEK